MNTAFETWWREEGSGITPNPGADMEEHAKRVCEIAWKKGAFIAGQEALLPKCESCTTHSREVFAAEAIKIIEDLRSENLRLSLITMGFSGPKPAEKGLTMRTTIARVLGTLRALVGRSEWPHPHLCFHHGGSEACEESNRRYGFECPRCHGEQDCNHCAHANKDEDDSPCCYCTGADPRWAPKANNPI